MLFQVFSQGKDHALYLWITLKPSANTREVARAVSKLQQYVDEVVDPTMRDEDDEVLAGVGFGPNFYRQVRFDDTHTHTQTRTHTHTHVTQTHTHTHMSHTHSHTDYTCRHRFNSWTTWSNRSSYSLSQKLQYFSTVDASHTEWLNLFIAFCRWTERQRKTILMHIGKVRSEKCLAVVSTVWAILSYLCSGDLWTFCQTSFSSFAEPPIHLFWRQMSVPLQRYIFNFK
jgi:hypothetical protein